MVSKRFSIVNRDNRVTTHPNLNGPIFYSSLHHIHYTIWHNASSITIFFLTRISLEVIGQHVA